MKVENIKWDTPIKKEWKKKIDKAPCRHLIPLKTITLYNTEDDQIIDEQACPKCGEIMTPSILEQRRIDLKKFNINI